SPASDISIILQRIRFATPCRCGSSEPSGPKSCFFVGYGRKAGVVGGNAPASRLGKENRYERRSADCGQFWQAIPLSAPVSHGCLQLPMFVLLAGRLQKNRL